MFVYHQLAVSFDREVLLVHLHGPAPLFGCPFSERAQLEGPRPNISTAKIGFDATENESSTVTVLYFRFYPFFLIPGCQI